MQDGAVALLDGAYEGEKCCQAVLDSGRIPVVRIRDNYRIRGNGARAEMIRRFEADPIKYKKQNSKRSKMESVFSSVKTRLGPQANARSLETQRVSIVAKCSAQPGISLGGTCMDA